ncbi:interference hedgehog-like isoform X2 [Toxorhynchites rutilus septentrionalis]|uniref:interference hedgehog-like isoform X2 n=1 Tax=Toxorhynchites rutilus septentrionalis TaxID=329112 RepID=UPI002478AB12|nr:interference hedgehog-like isoform X2 [Toxorhynchites rutilus septentrionalis]
MFTTASTDIDSRLSVPSPIEVRMTHKQNQDGFSSNPAIRTPCRRHNSRRSTLRLHAPSRTSSLLIALVLSCPLLALGMPYASHHSFPPSAGSSSGGSAAVVGSTKSLGVYMIRSPESTTAPAGDEVLFECELNLIPERLEWRFRAQGSHNGREDYVFLSKNLGYNVTTIEGSSKLHVYVNSKTIGEYQCVAWFGASAIASIPARLMLASISLDSSSGGASTDGDSYGSLRSDGSRSDRVPTMMRRVSPIMQQLLRISPGNSIIIKCGDVISNPPAIWSYYKDEVPIAANPQLATGGLILSQMTPQDSGTYRCSAVNSITGNELKLPQKTTIIVEYTPRASPKATYKPQNVSVTPGSTALLECPGVANPVPRASWFRRDGLTMSDHSQVFPYGLQIYDVSPKDQGEYVCRLENGIEPSLVHTVRLTVLEVPRIVEPPRATLTNESESLQLECLAEGSPAPDIYWMINGDYTKWDRLIKANGSKLFIKSVEKKHAGIVQCFARNEVGEVSEGNLLQVNPKQIPGGTGAPPLGSLPSGSKFGSEHSGKRQKGGKKHKHLIMIPPSRPNITRLSDESVMVRWSVPSSDGLPIQFFKVQYRTLGDPSKNIPRTQWMTENEDIPPYTRSYEVNGLKSDHFYRFRIVAVYSNNDNKEGAASGKFHLQRGSQLGLTKNHLLAPTLTRIESASQHAIVLHWQFPQHLPHPIDGFYAYYRPATTAGEYSKATVDTPTARHFKIDHLEPGTAYEFKLQSFTAAAASDFSAILTGKTLKPPTPAPVIPSVVAASESENGTGEVPNYVYMGVGGFVLILGGIVLLCCCCVACKKKRGPGVDEIDTKSHIQVDQNGGFPVSNGGSRSHHHKGRNGINARMNITSNPLAQDGDKQQQQQQHQTVISNNVGPCPIAAAVGQEHLMLASMPHRRTLERSVRNLQNGLDQQKMMLEGDCGVVTSAVGAGVGIVVGARNNNSSMRRGRRGSGSVPGSPRVGRGPSSEMLQHNRSPMPIRAAASGVKRAARLGRAENMSSGSLNSIEV